MIYLGATYPEPINFYKYCFNKLMNEQNFKTLLKNKNSKTYP